jgi:hypothetical protein
MDVISYNNFSMNHRNPGPFDGFNFPGTPQPVLFMGNFMSVASAKSAIDKMFHGTSDVTIHGLHLLAEFIIFHYNPGETIVIGMSQPGSFTTSPKYLVRIDKFSIIITLHFFLAQFTETVRRRSSFTWNTEGFTVFQL